MKDYLILMNIYKQYLDITAQLIEVLEKNYEQSINDTDEIKDKRKEFSFHAKNIIKQLNEDIHILFRISWELKSLEDNDKVGEE